MNNSGAPRGYCTVSKLYENWIYDRGIEVLLFLFFYRNFSYIVPSHFLEMKMNVNTQNSMRGIFIHKFDYLNFVIGVFNSLLSTVAN